MLEEVLREIAEESSADILSSLKNINQKQEEVQQILSVISQSLDENFRHDGFLFANRGVDDNFMDIDQYRAKIARLKKAMQLINDKSKRMQARLNIVRKQCPKHRTHIVQKGPFYYRCVYPGGVRYRELPSSTAKYIPSGTLISYDTRVVVAERIFINNESSVFLHVQGVGWLMENKGPMICLEMCGPPEKGSDPRRGDHPHHPRNNHHKGSSPVDVDDGLPPFPLRDKKHTIPVKIGFAAYEEDDDEHSCFREGAGQW